MIARHRRVGDPMCDDWFCEDCRARFRSGQVKHGGPREGKPVKPREFPRLVCDCFLGALVAAVIVGLVLAVGGWWR